MSAAARMTLGSAVQSWAQLPQLVTLVARSTHDPLQTGKHPSSCGPASLWPSISESASLSIGVPVSAYRSGGTLASTCPASLFPELPPPPTTHHSCPLLPPWQDPLLPSRYQRCPRFPLSDH